MKKLISILLVFAAVASLMSVCGFAADADAVGSVNGFLGKIVEAYAEFAGDITGEYNGYASELIFETGLNDLLGSFDGIIERICEGIVELVATVEKLFTK